MKVVSTSPSFGHYSSEPKEYLYEYGLDLVVINDNLPEDELIQELQNTEAVIVGYTNLTANIMEQCKKLKIICKNGVGVDNIDLQAAAERGIVVTNVPDGNKIAVAELSIGLMLSLARQIPQTVVNTKDGKWPKVVGYELFGKTLGVIGLGRIGRETAQRAKAFGMNVIAYDPYPDQEYATYQNIELIDFNDLLQESDFVTLHMP
ncbi:hypothetical protein KFZ58_15615 [Virgibacillus sp. NKC19-16]|nr:NAD(P)-dependent oxidoreductase [Virgibacillus sp. NKC19-16]UJL45795.1 hypothetical protein KFZ58_15615 [Virgibacillus sp. NKC19-16]